MVWHFGIHGIFEIRRIWLWRSVSDYRGNMVHLEARFDAVRLARYDSVEWFSA